MQDIEAQAQATNEFKQAVDRFLSAMVPGSEEGAAFSGYVQEIVDKAEEVSEELEADFDEFLAADRELGRGF